MKTRFGLVLLLATSACGGSTPPPTAPQAAGGAPAASTEAASSELPSDAPAGGADERAALDRCCEAVDRESGREDVWAAARVERTPEMTAEHQERRQQLKRAKDRCAAEHGEGAAPGGLGRVRAAGGDAVAAVAECGG